MSDDPRSYLDTESMEKPRKLYHKPYLAELGDLRTLTLGISGTGGYDVRRDGMNFGDSILPDGSILKPDGSIIRTDGRIVPPGK